MEESGDHVTDRGIGAQDGSGNTGAGSDIGGMPGDENSIGRNGVELAEANDRSVLEEPLEVGKRAEMTTVSDEIGIGRRDELGELGNGRVDIVELEAQRLSDLRRNLNLDIVGSASRETDDILVAVPMEHAGDEAGIVATTERQDYLATIEGGDEAGKDVVEASGETVGRGGVDIGKWHAERESRGMTAIGS